MTDREVLDAIAVLLHPSWKGKSHTYVPGQLPAMVGELLLQRDELGRLLDNIDTLDDGCREHDVFRKQVYAEQRKRFNIYNPGGK